VVGKCHAGPHAFGYLHGLLQRVYLGIVMLWTAVVAAGI
jgi:hypothetical protein